MPCVVVVWHVMWLYAMCGGCVACDEITVGSKRRELTLQMCSLDGDDAVAPHPGIATHLQQ